MFASAMQDKQKDRPCTPGQVCSAAKQGSKHMQGTCRVQVRNLRAEQGAHVYRSHQVALPQLAAVLEARQVGPGAGAPALSCSGVNSHGTDGTNLAVQAVPWGPAEKACTAVQLKGGRQHRVLAARCRPARLDVPWSRTATALLPDELLQHG